MYEFVKIKLIIENMMQINKYRSDNYNSLFVD
jgi:hypothetical protein